MDDVVDLHRSNDITVFYQKPALRIDHIHPSLFNGFKESENTNQDNIINFHDTTNYKYSSVSL